MDACDQGGVSHIELGQGLQDPRPHREGVYDALVVPRPHLAILVAHGQKIGPELEGVVGKTFQSQVSKIQSKANQKEIKTNAHKNINKCFFFFNK